MVVFILFLSWIEQEAVGLGEKLSMEVGGVDGMDIPPEQKATPISREKRRDVSFCFSALRFGFCLSICLSVCNPRIVSSGAELGQGRTHFASLITTWSASWL